MAEAEEYFPRGGKKPSVLFKKSANFLGAPEKTEKKKKRPKKKTERDDGYLSDEETREIDASVKNCAIGLSYKTVKEGVLVLGRVRQIHETRVIVMLPCRLMGNVMACHISEPYNKVLEAYVNDQTENVPELGQMFRPGQYIAVKVLEAQDQSLMLSTMPQHVNGGKQHTDMVKGAIFQAAVSSVEDHGYVMDIGIPNTRTFLPKDEVNPELNLEIGMVTWCAIKSVSPSSGSSIVTLSTTPSYLQGGVLRHKQNTTLLPGTGVEFTVDTPLDNGIEGTIFGETTCFIQRQHVDKVRGKKPALGQKIRTRVLYVMPTRNTPFLTMKNIFETTYPDLAAEQKYKDGDIIEGAQVLKITGRSVRLKLPGGASGLLSLRRIQVDEDLADEDVIAKSYPLGSTHKVRVLCYNLSDYVYSVTDQREVLNEQYFSLSQLSPGDLVPATVKSVSEKGVELNVGRVKGYVPQSHLTEAGTFIDPKKARTSKLPQKKFKVGQSVKARVLAVDPVKNSLTLTLKPSLLAPDLQPLTKYEDAEVGKAYVGVIRLIRDYILVSFFNNVTAFIPRWFITQDSQVVVADAFHLGQIVSCTIVNVNPDEKKMTASLVTAPFVPDEDRPVKRIIKRKQNLENSDEVAQKKQKSDDEGTDTKRKKKKQTEDILEESNTKPKKKKKRYDTESSQDNMDAEEAEINTKKKNRHDSESSQNNIDTEESEVIKKKKKRHDTESSQDNMDTEDSGINTKNKKKKLSVSEESDAIETDIYEEEDILTPQEQGLLDMSDCTTLKQYKKRVVAIIKAIEVRAKRMDVIDTKIESIEERGLTAKNKKYHTAMQSEKLLIKERTKKLMEALNTAQGKLKEMGYEKNDDYKLEQKKRRKEKLQKSKVEKEKVKEEKLETNEEEVRKDKLKEIVVVENLEPALDVPSAKDFWSANAGPPKAVEEEESSSSEDESKEQPKKKRKKLSAASKVSKAREEEERVRAQESAALAHPAAGARSVHDYERKLLAYPDSSFLWIGYMTFHLQATEIEKARGVARRALTTINFRDEQEKQNVWLALINLEHRFGTKESQHKALEEALQMNDPYSIHHALLEQLAHKGDTHEAASLVDLMLRKYSRNSRMYLQAGRVLFKLGLIDKGRHVMQRAVAMLDPKEHVNVLVQFASLELTHVGRERAEALFENLLTTYPQRVDVCGLYVDMLFKGREYEQVRQVMERMTSQNLSARRMKYLYQKWLEIEESVGDATQIERVKQRAMKFIENAQF